VYVDAMLLTMFLPKASDYSVGKRVAHVCSVVKYNIVKSGGGWIFSRFNYMNLVVAGARNRVPLNGLYPP